MIRRVYLDANATHGLMPEVLEYLCEVGGQQFNPSSLHAEGQRARTLIEDARETVRTILGAENGDTVLFTSGATEANNLAVLSAAEARPLGALFLNPTEHPSVIEPVAAQAQLGRRVERVTLCHGVGLPQDHLPALPGGALLTMMLANNESGVVYPVSDTVRRIRAIDGALWIHTDAVQAAGRMPIRFRELGVDSLSISGHKFGALMGVGALIVREGRVLTPMLRGGPQEGAVRAGTENVLGILSLARALSLQQGELESRVERMTKAREVFLGALRAVVPEVIDLFAAAAVRLPNTLSLRIPGVRGDDLVVALDRKGVAISSGAACAVGKPDPSHVLLAEGLSDSEARESVRVSCTAELSLSDAELAARCFGEAVQSLRRAELQFSGGEQHAE